MPIRFRCAYCNQLMGISRRKAGTVVRCPNCSGQVVVPANEDSGEGEVPQQAPAPAPAPAAVGGGKVFERNDFEEQLQQMTAGAGAPPADDADDADAFLVPAPMGPPPVRGMVLSTSMVTLLSVAIVVIIALAFVAGLLIGRFGLAR
ncbi:MAG: hypothetical protein AB7K24_19065 [Gemmataceae bacterium]